MKKFIFCPVLLLILASCNREPDFIKDQTWDPWVAEMSFSEFYGSYRSELQPLSQLRVKALEEVVSANVSSAKSHDCPELGENQTAQLITAATAYFKLYYEVPVTDTQSMADAMMGDYDNIKLRTAELYESDCKNLIDKFDIDVSLETFMDYLYKNNSLVEQRIREEIYGTYCLFYSSKLNTAVTVEDWKLDKTNSPKGTKVYEVIYRINIDDVKYAKCKVLEKKDGSTEISLESTSDTLLGL